MDIKPDSVYKDDWVWINFWIDKELYLPAKMVTLTTEEDFYEISFLNASVNEGLNDNVFQVQIPDGFAQPEVIPLRR
jgi:outer membrane lipoprotein-sorting protein